MWINSKQKNIRVMHRGVPAYALEFNDTALEVSEAVGKHLLEKNPFLFYESKAMKGRPASKTVWVKELETIKGIGPKTAEDIVEVYASKNDLLNSLIEGKHLPFDANVELMLKKEFGQKGSSFEKVE